MGCVVLSLGQNEVGKGETSGRKSQQGLGWEDKGLEDIGEKPYCLSITIQHRRILSFKPRYLNGVPFSSAATLKRKLPVLSFLCLMKFTYQNIEYLLVPGSPLGILSHCHIIWNFWRFPFQFPPSTKGLICDKGSEG